jgi:hypothetical protein
MDFRVSPVMTAFMPLDRACVEFSSVNLLLERAYSMMFLASWITFVKVKKFA